MADDDFLLANAGEDVNASSSDWDGQQTDTDADTASVVKRWSSQEERRHVQRFLKKTQNLRGDRLFGYIDAIYAIAATVMVIPTTYTASITNSTTYPQAALVSVVLCSVMAVVNRRWFVSCL